MTQPEPHFPVLLTRSELRSLVSFLDLTQQQLGSSLPSIREKLSALLEASPYCLDVDPCPLCGGCGWYPTDAIEEIALQSPSAEAAGHGVASPNQCSQGGAL